MVVTSRQLPQISGSTWWRCRTVLPLVMGLTLLAPDVIALPGRNVLAAPSESVERMPRSFVAEAVARSGPAVVTLETSRTVRTAGVSGLPQGMLKDPFFRRFFGLQVPQASRSRAVSYTHLTLPTT